MMTMRSPKKSDLRRLLEEEKPNYRPCTFCGTMVAVLSDAISPPEDGAVCESVSCQTAQWDLMVRLSEQVEIGP